MITLHHVYKAVEINLGMRRADLEVDCGMCTGLVWKVKGKRRKKWSRRRSHQQKPRNGMWCDRNGPILTSWKRAHRHLLLRSPHNSGTVVPLNGFIEWRPLLHFSDCISLVLTKSFWWCFNINHEVSEKWAGLQKKRTQYRQNRRLHSCPTDCGHDASHCV